ncbi:hypothetical protein pdam_00021817 [Pocillopora damicornis]|uniref:Uncharacterized protein n=1 Tax=Pocillopora damicornis TaxID=46731 RepID=A0A3M6U9N9_POCDA|nr:hypothetical protein pdam_00021817 [Pocillopora damicornis]
MEFNSKKCKYLAITRKKNIVDSTFTLNGSQIIMSNIKLIPSIMLILLSGEIVQQPKIAKLGCSSWRVPWIKRSGSWVDSSALTQMGVVTEVVIEMVLTIAELWNFTEGTFTVD